MKKWFVIHTQPMKEQTALDHLKEQGFSVYLPRYKKTRRHARKTEIALSPLFPRYLFVEFDPETERWRTINGTRGVAYLLMFNEIPARIPTETIRKLMIKEDEEGSVPIESLSLFTEGDKVRILEGAFEGYTAVFEKLDEKVRVQLLLNFLGRQTKVILEPNAIEAA